MAAAAGFSCGFALVRGFALPAGVALLPRGEALVVAALRASQKPLLGSGSDQDFLDELLHGVDLLLQLGGVAQFGLVPLALLAPALAVLFRPLVLLLSPRRAIAVA